MKKIISLFKRDYEKTRLVFNEVVSGAEWVIAGEGIATQKFDGTCCMIKQGKMWKRHEIKPGKKVPPDFQFANEVDLNTGKQQGWLPVGIGSEDKYHREAYLPNLPDGTYELCGPKIQGNPENFEKHTLIPHGKKILNGVPRDFEGLQKYFCVNSIEGIVWHNPDGRMVKIKAKDFGIKREKILSKIEEKNNA